jgi:ATP-dependent Clp protease ATP-binding subunit ClpB
MRALVEEALAREFRPEFLNRIDETIIFDPLTMDDLRQIVKIQVNRLSARLRERHIELELTPRAEEVLIEAGYDPAFGARPLKRAIQRELLDPLALGLLQGEFHEGDHIRIDADGGRLAFTRIESAEPVAV